jgi:hypothetical protein
MLLNPYFPDNVVFTLRHILPKLTETTAVDVGNEWYPYQTTTLLRNSPLALGAFLSGALALGLQERRIDARTLTAFLLAVLFGLMLFQSRRFIEYFPPFALIFAALAWTPIITGWRIAMNTRQAPASSMALRSRWAGWWISSRSWLPVGVLALVLILACGSRCAAPGQYRDTQPSTRYAASSWLVENTPTVRACSRPTGMTSSPVLSQYPEYLPDRARPDLYGADNAELYDLWVEITEGGVDHLSDVIAGRFGASYVISDLAHEDFLSQAEQDPNLREVYRDDEAVILQVVEGTN